MIKTGHTISAYVKQHLPIMLVEHLEQEGPDVGKALKKCKHSGILHVLHSLYTFAAIESLL